MTLDDQEKQKDLERQKLLEEIRRRAEEAELKRIEEEEQKADLLTKPLAPPVPPKPVSSVPTHPSPEAESSASRNAAEVNDLGRRFQSALDRFNLDEASEILAELTPLLGEESQVEELRGRMQKVRKQQQEDAKAKKHATEKRTKETAAQERSRREATQKKNAELLQKANSFYQSEKYDRATALLDELFALDPEHEEAKELAVNITKAKELAERIQEEEARRRAAEAATAKPTEPVAAPVNQTPAEVWGSKDVVRSEDEHGLPPIAESPSTVPKPPLIERVIERLSKIHIPLKPVLIGIGVVVVLASAYFVIISLKQAVFPPKYSLLIMPATSLSADSSSQFFAGAVTEDLINTVSSVGELRVVAPATAFSLRTFVGDYSRAARTLGARYFLSWAVSKVDDQVTFQTTLFDTSSSGPVWSRHTRNSVRELQSATREIGRAVVREMQVTLQPQEEQFFAKVDNTSPAAYDQYARGQWSLRQSGPQSVNDAIAWFTSSLDQDSLFTGAYIGLAWAHLVAVERVTDNAGSHVQMAWRNLNQALALGARSSMSHRVRGLIAQYQLQYDRAVEEFERGVALAPSDAETQRRLAVAYAIKGRIDDALRVAARALADDPRNVDSYTIIGTLQHLRDEGLRLKGESDVGMYTDAIKSFEKGTAYAEDKSKYASAEYSDLLEYVHQPDRSAQILVDRVAQTQYYEDYYKLGRIYQTAGRSKPQWESVLQRAKSLLMEHVAANPLDAIALSFLALVETRLGSFKNALEANAKARQLAPTNLDVLYNTARMYALQTDNAKAFESLGKALDVRYRLSSLLDMDFYNLRSDPQFQRAITR